MDVRFECPGCGRPGAKTGNGSWQCAHCEHELALTARPDRHEAACAVCGNWQLYRKKDFPQWLGLGLLTAACAGFLVGQFFYHQWLAWAILLASAAFDGLLYLWVGDAVVCYRCGAEHRDASSASALAPFELGVAERYRQERMRREQLRDGVQG